VVIFQCISIMIYDYYDVAHRIHFTWFLHLAVFYFGIVPSTCCIFFNLLRLVRVVSSPILYYYNIICAIWIRNLKLFCEFIIARMLLLCNTLRWFVSSEFIFIIFFNLICKILIIVFISLLSSKCILLLV